MLPLRSVGCVIRVLASARSVISLHATSPVLLSSTSIPIARRTMATKKQRTLPPFELLYHPGIPGRAEYIRLPLEAAGVAYTDVANEKKGGYDDVKGVCSQSCTSDDSGNPPAFAPPALRVPGAGKGGKGALVLHQTPNILAYLGPQIGMAGEDEVDAVHVSQIALTALDLNNEVHDSHHPVGVMLYYEDQKDESLRKSADVRENRIPKYFSYFERCLKGNEAQGKNKYLVGGKISYADTSVWQLVDGLYFAFPKEMKAREKEFPALLGTFYPSLKEEDGLKEYLASPRRKEYSMGIFRQYPELDRQ